ncbi:MAG: hypothetical protein ACRD2J_10685, partial [Thermoanaerobaculia bacterium]
MQSVAEAEELVPEEDYEASLRRLAAEGDETEQRRALARLAIHFRAEKRLDEAAAAFASAAEANPLIRSHLLLQLAEVEEERGELGRAAEVLRRVIGADDTPAGAKADARLRLAAVLAAAGDRDAALAALRDTAGVPIDEFTDEELAHLASALEKAGLRSEAADLRLRILEEYPGTRWAEAHYGALDALPDDASPLARLSFSESVRLADRLGRVNRYDQALDLLERIAERFPKQTDSADYRYTRARSLFNSRNYREMTE